MFGIVEDDTESKEEDKAETTRRNSISESVMKSALAMRLENAT
jgi:hypothetical protein